MLWSRDSTQAAELAAKEWYKKIDRNTSADYNCRIPLNILRSDNMKRLYKAFRFAFETKYWIDCLVKKYDENLQKQIEDGLMDQIENEISSKYAGLQNGVAFTFTLNVTTGSIIDMAIDATKNLTEDEWKELAQEAEIQKNHIEDSDLKDATPSVYLLQSTYDELEILQNKLRGDNPRVPKKAYVIKLAVYYLYKKTFC